jgi:hypothetical protein
VELPPWTLHDIRRTFVTNVNELAFAEPHIVEAIVNHISGSKAGVAGRYNYAQYWSSDAKPSTNGGAI